MYNVLTRGISILLSFIIGVDLSWLIYSVYGFLMVETE